MSVCADCGGSNELWPAFVFSGLFLSPLVWMVARSRHRAKVLFAICAAVATIMGGLVFHMLLWLYPDDLPSLATAVALAIGAKIVVGLVSLLARNRRVERLC